MKKYQDGGQGKETSKTRVGIGGRTIVKKKFSYGDDSRNYDRKTREVINKDGEEKVRTKTTVRPAGEKAETTVRTFKGSDMTSRPGMIPVKKGIMKTGGMVNSNAKIAADKTPGSKGVKSGVNPKAAASKVARGKVGGTSASPKTAVPKMAMGGTRPGMAKAGSKKYQTGGPTADQKIESGVRKNYITNAKAKLMGVAAAARKSSGRKGKI